MTQAYYKILLVDDEKKFLSLIADRVRLKGLEPIVAQSGEEAIQVARNTAIDLAIVDYKMPGIDGIVTITKLKELRPEIKTVLLTGYGNEKVKEAAQSLDSLYFEKDRMSEFWKLIHEYAPRSGMVFINPGAEEKGASNGKQPDVQAATPASAGEADGANARQPGPLAEDPGQLSLGPESNQLVGVSPPMMALKKDIRKVAYLDCTVLIQGETGTGKELVARAIHSLSPRREKKFMAVNCGSFSNELLSNELFGHEKEAFTGARHQKRGVFEAASGGTILLDEIGDTPLSMQIKLLRVLQERTILRVGGTDEISVDVRILAATNQSLQKKIAAGGFREDLYYRLNAFILRIPPLRDRGDDIPLLAHYFLDKYRKTYGKAVKRIGPEALAVFMKYPFPGNVRELENAIERAVILCEGDAIAPSQLPRRFFENKTPARHESQRFMTLAELERQHILKVLKAMNGNKSETARVLGINRASLWRKLKQFDAE